jgi:hypothetical protein
VVLSVLASAVVAVGLSAAAATSAGGPGSEPARDQAAKPTPAKAKAKTRSRAEAADAQPVVSSGQRQTSEEVEQYWTEERMDGAQPMGKTRQGGSPATSPAPTGNAVPGSPPARRVPSKQKSTTKRPQASTDPRVAHGPSAGDPTYWTDERLADATPMDKSRPGGGSQGSTGVTGPTAPGSPPP